MWRSSPRFLGPSSHHVGLRHPAEKDATLEVCVHMLPAQGHGKGAHIFYKAVLFMMTVDMQAVAEAVVRRAERQGFIVPREIREEVTHAGLPESTWKEVLELARPNLNYRHGRYHHLHPVSERVQQAHSQQQAVQSALRQIMTHHRKEAKNHERREQERIEFVHSLRVETEDNRTFHVLSRDLSITGLRLISTRSFLGQKIRVTLPRTEKSGPWTFAVRVLWTCAIGDDLFENGGAFLELLRGGESV
jgi:hypothetical protein